MLCWQELVTRARVGIGRGENDLKIARLGILATAAILLASLGSSGLASAQEATLSMSSAAAERGGDPAVVLLEATGVGEPGLGGWVVDVSYDPAVVSVADCRGIALPASACNEEFGESTVRFAGAVAVGLVGETVLGQLELDCEQEFGSTSLDITIFEFHDGTIGDPQPIDVSLVSGRIDCAPLPTTPKPTPTPPLICTCNGVCGCVPAPTCDDFDFQEDAQAAYDARRFSLPDIAAILDEDGDGIACEMLPRRQLPETGTGLDASPSRVAAWLIVGLAAAGLAGVLATSFVLRLRR